MRQYSFNRILSFILVMVMVIIMIPTHFFPQALADDGKTSETGVNPPKEDVKGDEDDDGNTDLEDFFWDIIKYQFVPEVEANGLPEGASADLEVLGNPFAPKRGAKGGSKGGAEDSSIDVSKFLDFYDIKALDADGNEIHPTGEVEVKISNARIKKNQSVYLIHVLDNEDVIRDADNVTLISDSAFVRAFSDAANAAENALGKSGVVAVEYIYDIDQDGRDLTFKTSSFSIFIIAENPILTVNFYKGAKSDANKIVSIKVKRADTADAAEFERIIYDPGVNETLPDDVLFRGWFENNNYTVEDAEYYDEATQQTKTNALTIAQVREKVAAKLNTEFANGDEIDFYAMLYSRYTVTYFDQAGKVCLGRDFVLQRYDGADTEVDYQVTLNYVPYGQFENFEGWKLKLGDKVQGDGFYTSQAQHMVGIYTTTPPDGTPEITGNAARDHIYTTPTWTRISGDIYLQAESPEGHWLVFNENGKGATYIAPQFVKKGSNTLDPQNATDEELGYPKTMYRTGYTFGGWYYSKQVNGQTVIDLDRPFTFGQTLNENTTVYAKWDPVPTATYTVIIWKQNVKGTGYDFEEVMQFTGNTNTAISNVTAQGTGNDRAARIGNRTYTYAGFHLDHFNDNNEEVIIAPEGTSVFHVYYNRNEYTLTFQVNGATVYSLATDDTTTPQYALVNGAYVRLTRLEITAEVSTPYTGTRYSITTVRDNNNPRHYGVVSGRNQPVQLDRRDNNRWYYDGTYYSWGTRYYGTHYIIDNNGNYAFVNGEMLPINSDGTVTTTAVVGYKWQLDGVDYNGDRYVASTSTGWTTVKEIKALYQQSIADNFPIVGTNGVTYNNGERWAPQSNNVGWSQVMVIIDTMPNGNVTFHLDTASRPLKTMYYYVEALPTDTNTVTHKGTRYVLYSSIGARYNGVTEEDYLDLNGFTKHDVTGSINGNTLSKDGNGFYIYNTSQDQSIYFFYTRDKYKIHYFDGLCVNGNNEPQEEVDLGLLRESSDIYYEADISSYGPDYYTPTRDNYKFEGWYLDEYCTQPYEFDTMPEGGVVVYAKWIQVQYRVFLHPNVPSTDVSLKWGVDEHGNEVSQAMNFRISLGGTVSVPTGLRDDYVFAGWYTDSACTKSFIPATQLNETTVKTPYDKTVDMTDPMDKYGELGSNAYNADATGYNGGDRFWIIKKLDLYAKWRSKIVGADGLYVKFVTTDPDIDNDGTADDPGVGHFADNSTEYCDGILYADNAFAYGLAASDPPSNDLHFRYWIVQEWVASGNNGEGAFEDSTIIVYPGERFDTLYRYAQRVPVSPSDPDYNNPNDHDHPYDPDKPVYYYDYYMVLRAEYTPAVPQETTIVYDANGGSFNNTVPNDYTAATVDGYETVSKTIIVNDQINILPGTVVSREGYTFMGWSLERNGDKYLDGGETGYSADNLTATPDGNDPSNTLYAIWEITRYSVDVKKVVENNGWTPSGTETFNITYEVTFPEGYVRDNTKDVPASDSFTLTNNQTETIEKIPHGSTIKVTESTYDAFGTVYTESQEMIVTSNGGVITITNTRKTAKVTVKKVVVGPVDDLTEAEKVFSFTASATLNGTSIGLNEGDSAFTLTAGGEPVVIEVPAGAIVTVTETQGTDFKFYTDTTVGSSITYNTNTYKTAALAENANEVVTFTNTRKVTVKAFKELDANGVTGGIDAWTDAQFPITFSYTDPALTGTQTATGHVAQDGSATDNSLVVRYGTSVTVTEDTTATVNGRTVSEVFTVTQPAVVTAGALENTVTITNTLKVATVTVDKTVVGFDADKTSDKKFSFTLTAKLGSDTLYTETFELSHGGSKTITVPAGTKVTVVETADSEFYTDVNNNLNTNEFTIDMLAEGGTATVSFTNTRKIKVYAQKVIDNKGSADTSWDAFMFPVTFTSGSETKTGTVVQGVTALTSLPFIEVRFGAQVSVEEDTSATNDGLAVSTVFDTTYDPATVTADQADQIITITNTRKVFTVTVSKIAQAFAPDAVFSFTATGLSKTSFTLGNGDTETFENVPYGTVITVTEATDDAYYIGSRSISGATADENGNITVTNNVDITYTNEIQYYPIVVTKTVTSLDPDDNNKQFNIVVAGTRPDGTPFTYELKLKHGESNNTITPAVPISVPYGSTYTVTETVLDNFKTPVIDNNGTTVTAATASGTVSGNVAIGITNERETVEIDIEKVVTYDGDKDTDFTFNVTAPGVNETVKVSAANGYASGYGKVTVPKGSSVTVTETGVDAVAFTVTSAAGDVAGSNTISFNADANTTVTFTNKRNPVTITVTKTLKPVDGVTVDGDDEITFPILIKWVDDVNGAQEREVSLANAGTYTINNVLYGSTVEIGEPNLDTDFEIVSGTGTFNDVIVNTDFEVVNRRKTVNVIVNKTVIGTDKSFTFTPVATWDNKAVALSDFELANGGSQEIVLPMGAILTVTETPDTDYFTQVYSGASRPETSNEYKITEAIVSRTSPINFVNTEIVDVTVTKSFTGNVAGDDSKKFDIKVSYTDAQGTEHTNEQTTLEGASTVGFANGESKTYKVLYGTEFTVYEATEQYFLDPEFAHTEGGNTTAGSDANTVTYTIVADDTVTVTNARDTVTVKVTKTVNGADKNFAFNAVAKVGGADVELAAADASKTMGNGGEWTIHLPKGATLTVTETGDAKYYTTVALNGGAENHALSQAISTAITDNDNEIAFTNTEILTVTVKKSFSGSVAGDSARKFDIDVAYTDGSAREQSTTVSLADDDEVVSFSVLYGTTFTVNEAVDTDLFKDPQGTGEFTITADKDIVVINERKTTSVTVTKEVVGADLAKDFTFNASAKVGDDDVLFDGTASKTFSLNGTEGSNTITITLPAGAVFTVTETKAEGYNTYVNGSSTPVAADAAATYTTGELAAGAETTVSFKNVQLVTIKFKKVIANPQGVTGLPEFTDFTVNYTQEGLTGTQSIVLPAEGTEKSITVEYGTEISGIAEDISRTNADGIAVGTVYEPSYSATSADGEADTAIIVTNTVKTYELKIFKITDDGVGGTFKFRLATTNLRANLTVNDTVTADSATGYYSIRLPYGTAFTVVEILEDTEHYNASLISYVPADGAAGYVLKGDGSVTINNFRNPVMVKIIKTVVSDVDADRLGTYDFRYTYTKGNTSDTQNVSIDLSVQDYVEFTVPAGSAVSVEETGVDTVAFKVEYTIGNAKTAGTTADLGTLNDIAYTVTFTNTRNLVDVTVKKIVKNFGSSAAKFPFSATWTVGGQTEDIEITGEENKLANGGEWAFKVPYGAVVNVVEDGSSEVAINGTDYAISTAFDTTYSIDGSAEAEGLAAATAEGVTAATEFVFTNTRKDVDIKLVKTLDNKGVNDAWNTTSFPLQYRITDSNNTTNWATVNVPAGETGVLLSEYDAQVKVPFGATVEVKEDTAYTPEGLHSIADTFTVTVPDAQVTTDAVTTFTVVNVRKMVDITVNKELDSDDPDENKSFTFDITTAVAATTGKQTITVGNDGKGSFTFQVPYGTDVTIKETGVSADDFDTFIDGTQTTDYIKTFTDVTDTDNGYSVTYLNKRMINVPVTKIVESSEADDYTDYAFTYTWTRGDEGETDVPLTVTVTAANKSGTATVRIPYGATITVTETEILNDAGNPVFQTLVNGVETLTTPDVVATTANVGANGAKLADLTFTNRKLYTVTVRKFVDNLNVTDELDEQLFPFVYFVNGTVGYNTTNDGATFELGKYAAASGNSPAVEYVITLPYGAGFVLEEVDAENFGNTEFDLFELFTVQYEDYAGNMGDDGFSIGRVIADTVANVYNTRNTRKITVTKTVDSKVAADFRTYVFYKSTDNWAGAAGSGQLELTPETINVAVSSDSFEIPVGLEFTVTEDTAGAGFAGMDTYVGIGSAEKAKDNKLTVAAGLDDVTVNFLNVRVTAELTIVKNVEGEDDCDRAFIFEITAKDQETGYSYTNRVVIVGNGQVTLNQLQTGYTYTVTELTGWSYEYDVKSVAASDKLQNVIVSKVGGVLTGAVSFYFVEDGTVTFGNKANETNWLRDEAYVSNLRYVWENQK